MTKELFEISIKFSKEGQVLGSSTYDFHNKVSLTI